MFGRLDHEVLLNILGEHIHDNRFLRLIRRMLQAGYLEEWRWHQTLSGAPQGGVWVAQTSLLKTLAGKHRSTVTKMARKYKTTIETEYGPRKCLQVVVQRGDNKKPLVAHFGGIPLKRKHEATLVDRLPQFVMTNRSELLQRVLADTCELCGSREKVEVHHIRKLADLEKPGRREKPLWVKQMAARRRKTLMVCRECHEKIHAGTSTASFRKQGPESRMTQKWSSPVRDGGNGTGP